MKRRIKNVLIVTALLLTTLLQAQSLDTVVTKQLKAGWNLVGFMGQTPEETQEAFAQIMDKVEIIKSFDGFYTPELQSFLNSLDNVLPLDGVMIKVSEDCLLERTIKKSAILYQDTKSQSLADVIAIGNSANGQIKGLTSPTDAQDAVTKEYVDVLKAQITANEQRWLNELDVQAGTKVRDVDGNYYSVIKIRIKRWLDPVSVADSFMYIMGENLRVTRLPNGDPIQYAYSSVDGNEPPSDKSLWWSEIVSNNPKATVYTWYRNDKDNFAIPFGAYYTYEAMLAGYQYPNISFFQHQGICPNGWHVAHRKELEYLENLILSNAYKPQDFIKNELEYWNELYPNETNSTKLSFVGTGYIDYEGNINLFKDVGFLRMCEKLSAFYLGQNNYFGFYNFNQSDYNYTQDYNYIGLPIRCIKDVNENNLTNYEISLELK
ncbi:MAG: fibrobacter succinogenes major paralogous domain-containing protein [Bacteroidales bacterium]|nr:fibrobacter succinogenes major paralogous domain-containing protein [Bacteroidales bacterium]